MKRVETLGTAMAAVVCLLTFADAAHAASQAEEARFVTDVKKVTQKKDLQGMLAMVCWDQVDAKTRKMVEGHLKDVLKAPVKNAALEDYTDFPFKTKGWHSPLLIELTRVIGWTLMASGLGTG